MKIRITISNGMASPCNRYTDLTLDDEDVNSYEEGRRRDDFIDECVHEHVMQTISYSWDVVE